jgi:hypothetical protein
MEPIEMLVQQLFPKVVGDTGTLAERLVAEANAHGIVAQRALEIITAVPPPLIDAPCFLDRLTGLWRYEFGNFFTLDHTKTLLWGTHMWRPVTELFLVLACAHDRLPESELSFYLQRLANIEKHRDVLVEMLPMLRVNPSIPVAYEMKGRGQGNKTIDWLIEPPQGRAVLFEVKRRVADFIQLMDAADVTASPQHDPAILFPSVESKFLPTDPDVTLRGVWIATEIAQESTELRQAFDNLDPQKVHFAMLGDAKDDAFIIARRSADEDYLREIFKVRDTMRFTFNRSGP